MTRLTLSTYPNMLGFEQLERLLERASKNGNEGYPPVSYTHLTLPTSG